MKRIVISGYYGCRNTGDEAILDSMVKSLRKVIPKVEITIFAENPQKVMQNFGVRAVSQPSYGIRGILGTVTKRRIHRILKELWKTDLFVLGGGGFLSDWQPRVLPAVLGQLGLAKLFRKPTMIYAMGAGPISMEKSKRLTRRILNRVNIITVRDGNSREWLRQAGVSNDIIVTADPALNLMPVSSRRARQIINEESGPKVAEEKIGISVAPNYRNKKKWPDGYGRFLRFRNVCIQITNYIVEDLGADVMLIPMAFPSDRDFSIEIQREVTNQDKVKVIKNEYSPNEMAGIIGQMDMIIGMRLHSLILAALMNVPMVGIIYHYKVAAFLSAVGQRSRAVSIGEGINWERKDIDVDELKLRVDEVRRDKEQIRVEMKRRIPTLQERAFYNAELAKQLVLSKRD